MEKKDKRVFIVIVAGVATIVMLFSFFIVFLSARKKALEREYVLEEKQLSLDNLSEDPFDEVIPPKIIGKSDEITEDEPASQIEERIEGEIPNQEEKEDDFAEEPEVEIVEQGGEEQKPENSNNMLLGYTPIDISSIPEYEHNPYVILNNNIPFFDENDKSNPTFEYYSPLDSLGRCGAATANLAKELMPNTERGPMGHIKPTGWHTVKYPDQIGDVYLYNRCHLIAFSLAGENDNVQNLITGTRFMNISGMLPFEKEVASYIDSTNHHVLYRVIPYFIGDELVARGVQMEAYSIEDNGKGVCFNVFVYNVQPGIGIDYSTGESWISE